MDSAEIPGLREFLRDYPQMAIRPCADKYLRLKGRFAFHAQHPIEGQVQDSFALQIDVPHSYPKELPEVRETEGRIPRFANCHVNGDGTLCLGSPLSLLLKLSQSPSLLSFAEHCLVPYFFAISRKLKSGGPLVFGELAHGSKGMLADYAALFGLKQPEQAQHAIRLLGMKRRQANKFSCPCGCGVRLGRCAFNATLRVFRSLTSRSWYKKQYMILLTEG